MSDKNTPPKYNPNAIPTKFGWVDCNTGELLISCKGLTGVINIEKANKPLSNIIELNKNDDVEVIETDYIDATSIINDELEIQLISEIEKLDELEITGTVNPEVSVMEENTKENVEKENIVVRKYNTNKNVYKNTDNRKKKNKN